MKAVLVLLVSASTAVAGPDRRCATTRIPHPVIGAQVYSTPATRTIYLNRHGGLFNITTGMTDSSTNTASVIATGDNQPHPNITIPPIDAVFDWPYIVACVKTQYQPYDVIVTETRPASGNYVEAVVGGDGSTNGFTSADGILGVAAADNFCGVTEQGIAFAFATNHIHITKPNDELCATVAHEVGHLLALEHEISTIDTMSYVPFATANMKSFTTPDSHCGTDDADQTNCSCTTTGPGEVTSSAVRLTQFLGLRPIESTPPTLAVMSPGDNAKLPPSFDVVATATDDTAMAEVAVLLDGNVVGENTIPAGTTYTVSITGVPVGSYTMEVQAIDLAGNITKQDLAITVALAATGNSCVASSDCTGSICAADDNNTSFCTQLCDDTMKCPSDFECDLVGTQNICVPSSGGCAIGGGDRRAMMLLLGLVLWRLRRTRSRR